MLNTNNKLNNKSYELFMRVFIQYIDIQSAKEIVNHLISDNREYLSGEEIGYLNLAKWFVDFDDMMVKEKKEGRLTDLHLAKVRKNTLIGIKSIIYGWVNHLVNTKRTPIANIIINSISSLFR